jgi:cell division protein FtsL
MREIRVDFAQPRRIPVWLLALALVVSGGAFAWQLWNARQARAELRDARAEVAALNAQLEEARRKQKALLDAQSQAAQTPQARLRAKIRSFPLEEVLASVENSKADGVRLTLLDISASDGAVRIECDYDRSESVFAYLDKLNAGAARKWELTSLKAKADGSGAGAASIVSKW